MSPRRGEAMGWYQGPTLLEHLETVPIDSAADEAKPFRMPVQWVNRPDQHFRGFAGQIASGRIAPGDEVRILPSGRIGADRPDRDDGRRPGRSGRRPVGHADADPGSRLLARRRDRRGQGSAARRRPVRSDDRVDGRRAADPGPRLLAEARHANRDRDRRASQAPAQRQHAGGAGGEDARPERDRRRRDHDRPRASCSSPIATSMAARPTARSAASS